MQPGACSPQLPVVAGAVSGWLVGTGSSLPPPAEPPGQRPGQGVEGNPSSVRAPTLSPTSRSLSSLACEPQDPASWGRTQRASGSARDVALRIQLLPPWDQQSPTIFPGSHPGLEGDAGSQKPIESQTH